MAIELSYKGETTIPVEAECVVPEGFAGKSAKEIAKSAVQHGNATAELGDFFKVRGESDDGRIWIEGDCSRVKLIGTKMGSGEITIDGKAGMHLGAEMTGGTIICRGDAGDWVGAEMRGGLIHVHGDAGHLIGSAYRGGLRGMRGGTILIRGSAKNEIAASMRRGLIAIGGDAGDFVGVNMIAGSVLVFGEPGLRYGAGMKRGTIGLFGQGSEGDWPPVLPTFTYSGTYRPHFMTVFLKQLEAWEFPVPAEAYGGVFDRYNGDMVALGLGEVLRWKPE